MGNTKISDIYKSFLMSIQDYRIKNLFKDNIDIAEDLMRQFLESAISKFFNCKKDIYNIDFENGEFNCQLDIREKNIIKDLMVVSWVDWCVNDITQMNWSLNDLDFKHFSEEKNLKEKSEYGDRLREKVNQDMINYDLLNIPFEEWAVGNYGL